MSNEPTGVKYTYVSVYLSDTYGDTTRITCKAHQQERLVHIHDRTMTYINSKVPPYSSLTYILPSDSCIVWHVPRIGLRPRDFPLGC